MYWIGLVLNFFIAGSGYLVLPPGRRLSGAGFFFLWAVWMLIGLGFALGGWIIVVMTALNLTSVVHFRNTWELVQEESTR
ncbi:hypothetical protein [Marinithermus hydrothermalis]|uniref:Uncharacterized protein n=1 Tax=Marinithermus hydrothermalis (strain DSM 14884 / JCM 11576 / T1) TaxID=869210 RepID=F2NPV6_MARHT|nr:hypothetical protein [Marinithermus hydrothermalis]AEB12882.1 hypothetical protein Marky_2159 [Marinithermus hydrothermalis DSM 14884]